MTTDRTEGATATIRGPWSVLEIRRFLEEVRVPVRLACNGTSGQPVLASLWVLPEDDHLWCATPRHSRIATLLYRDPACAFDVSLESVPYRGLRGQGRARLHDDRGEEILRRLIDRYLGKTKPRLARSLLSRAATETAIEIEPERLFTWDYTERMGEDA
jgi:nitroimidazol reductase NimA-like FMN-containing flavoprotein (pyridoxamine 5'-phosphate oxidase superfamily)